MLRVVFEAQEHHVRDISRLHNLVAPAEPVLCRSAKNCGTISSFDGTCYRRRKFLEIDHSGERLLAAGCHQNDSVHGASNRRRREETRK